MRVQRTLRTTVAATAVAVAVSTMAAAPSTGAPAAPSTPVAAERAAARDGAAARTGPGTAARPAEPAKGVRAVAPADRARMLGATWEESKDRAWTTSGDASGLHVLVADEAEGYEWRTAATLSEPGLEADSWVGNACVAGDGRTLVAAYAPRTFTNKAPLVQRGAFVATVDLRTGVVTKLPVRSSMAYFSPSLRQRATRPWSPRRAARSSGRTRLAVGGRAHAGRWPSRSRSPASSRRPCPRRPASWPPTQVASSRSARDGSRRLLAPTTAVPFELTVAADGSVVYLDREGDRASVHQVPAARIASRRPLAAKPRALATGPLVESGLTRSAHRHGRAAGVAARRARPAGRRAARGGGQGRPLLEHRRPGDRPRGPGHAGRRGRLGRGRRARADPRPGDGHRLAPALRGGPRRLRDRHGHRPRPAGPAARRGLPARRPARRARARPWCPARPPSSSRPSGPAPCRATTRATRPCSPSPGRWSGRSTRPCAARLTTSRPANWKNLGMPAYTPQGLFPPRTLSGGGNVPAQVFLGIARAGVEPLAGGSVRRARRHLQPADRQLLRDRLLRRQRRQRLGRQLAGRRLRLRRLPGDGRHAPGRQGATRRDGAAVQQPARDRARLRRQRRGRAAHPAGQVEPDPRRRPDRQQRRRVQDRELVLRGLGLQLRLLPAVLGRLQRRRVGRGLAQQPGQPALPRQPGAVPRRTPTPTPRTRRTGPTRRRSWAGPVTPSS